MTNQSHTSQVAIASRINLVLGIWLIISPWFYSTGAPGSVSVTWNNVLTGILIVICTAVRSFSPHRRVALSGVNIVLGIWTLISPWVYGYVTNAPWFSTNIVVGTVVIVLAIWSGSTTYVCQRHQRHA